MLLNVPEVDHPKIAGHGPLLYQGGLLNTRRLDLIPAKPLRNSAVARAGFILVAST